MPLGAARLSLLAYQAAVAATGRTAITLTAQQQVQVSTAQSKFGGASAYFDGGTDDYILVDHTQFSHAYSDNFTYECWFRLDSLPSVFTMLATGSTRGDYLSIYNKSGTWTVTAPVSDGSTAYTQIRNIGFTPSINTWYHVALVKDGASLKMFFDGTELTTNNGSAGTMSADKGWNGVSRIGDWASGTNYATLGYIDEVRWSSTARYTSGFTPSTTAFANDSDTLLLVHMDGANGSTTFTDDTVTPARTAVTLTANGNAQVDTSQSKFGGASLVLDGNDDWLQAGDGSQLNLGSNDFTIEAWIRLNSIDTAGSPFHPIVNKYRTSNSQRSYAFGVYDGKLGFFWASSGSSGNAIQGNFTFSTNTWYHVAATRSGNTLSMYVNGTRYYENTNFTPTLFNNTIEPVLIGSYFETTEINGWLDEVRMSSIARYTGSSYTVPTTAFANDADTLLLIHADGTDGSTTFTDDNS